MKILISWDLIQRRSETLCAAGEVAEDGHDNNRLGGIFLLECVDVGRVAGADCAKYMLGDQVLSGLGVSEKVEVFNLEGGSYEDTIMSNFLSQHPGGELAISTCAGKNATSKFDMVHPPDVVEKYVPDAVIGVSQPQAFLLSRQSLPLSVEGHRRRITRKRTRTGATEWTNTEG